MDAEAGAMMSARRLRAELLARRERVLAEIRAHPPAIPACDAHFNHLLQQRDALGRDLGQLADILAAEISVGEKDRLLADFLHDTSRKGIVSSH